MELITFVIAEYLDCAKATPNVPSIGDVCLCSLWFRSVGGALKGNGVGGTRSPNRHLNRGFLAVGIRTGTATANGSEFAGAMALRDSGVPDQFLAETRRLGFGSTCLAAICSRVWGTIYGS